MSDGKPPKFIFVNTPGTHHVASQQDRQLQAAAVRSHAARISKHRPTVEHVKRATGSQSVSGQVALSGVLVFEPVLRPVPGPALRKASRRNKHVQRVKGDNVVSVKKMLFSPSTSSLGQGQVDPFDSAPVQGLDNFIYSMLDFAYDYAFPSFTASAPVSALSIHRANRRRLGRQYGYLLEAQIAAAARFQSSPMASVTEENRRQVDAIRLVHEQRATELVDREARHLTTTPPDTLINAAALLAYTSGPSYVLASSRPSRSPLATAQNLHAMGHQEIVPDRVQIVRMLVQLRGGIDLLAMPFQRIVLTYLDTIVSTRLGVRPGWKWPAGIPESLQSTSEHVLDRTALELMQTMGSGFRDVQHEGMRHALRLICEATVALDHCHRGGPTAPSIFGIARMRIAVQHRLCSFEPISPSSTTFTDRRFELCRLAALIFSDLVLFPIPEYTSVKPPLLYELGRTLDLVDIDGDRPDLKPGNEASGWWQVRRDFLDWCVLLGAAAATTSKVLRHQWVERLQKLIRRDGQTWEVRKRIAMRYLWWDHVLDPMAREAFQAIL